MRSYKPVKKHICCPECGSEQIYVYATYDYKEPFNGRRRYRRCRACGYDFKTMELSWEQYETFVEQAKRIEVLEGEISAIGDSIKEWLDAQRRNGIRGL